MLAILDSYPIAEPRVADETIEEPGNESRSARATNDQLKDLLDALQREGHFHSKLDRQQYEAIADAYKRSHLVTKTFTPARFRGVILLFVATEGGAKQATESWGTFVDGEIRTYPIDCSHEAMMEPRAAAEIGRVLATDLNKQRINPSYSSHEPE